MAWQEANAHWLRPYAAFCLMRDLLHSSEHWTWGDAGANPTKVRTQTVVHDCIMQYQ